MYLSSIALMLNVCTIQGINKQAKGDYTGNVLIFYQILQRRQVEHLCFDLERQK